MPPIIPIRWHGTAGPAPSPVRRRALGLAAAGLAAGFRMRPAHADTLIRLGGTGSSLAAMRFLADAFRRVEPATEIDVLRSLGTTGGLRGLRANVVEIAVAARPLTEAERASGLVGREYARTPLVFATHPETRADSVTLAEVAGIYGGDLANWPSGARIRLVRRPSTEADWAALGGLSPDMARAVQVAIRRPGLLTAASDQDNADALERLLGSFGLIALGQLLAERRRLTVLRLGGVEPTVASLLDGAWPMVRTLHIVTPTDPAPHIAAFLAFVASAEGAAVLANCGHLPVQAAS